MPDPNEPPQIIDPRLGSLLVSARGPFGGSPPSTAIPPLEFGPPTAAGEVGTLGPYRIMQELGRGNMGAVFLALDTRLDRSLALKVMRPEFAADAEGRARFLREAKSAARIDHDNVVTVYEADERNGVPYIAMQLLRGYPLDAFLALKGAPSLRNIVRIAREAALGLAAAHRLGVVHRDIKPANLWLESPQGRVKLLDFGLARPDGMDNEITKSGAVIGTPAFMSPEQALGEQVDHRTDLFSLGSVLYWLCTGQLPFQGASVVAVLMALGTVEPQPVHVLNPDVPPPLAELIHWLLAKSPAERPQTAAEVANHLHEILELPTGLSSVAPPSAPPPISARVETSDPWLTRALKGPGSRAGYRATPPAAPPTARPAEPLIAPTVPPAAPIEPRVLHSMPVVAITPTASSNEEPGATSAPDMVHTLISSGALWEKPRSKPRERSARREYEAPKVEYFDRPRRTYRRTRRKDNHNGAILAIIGGSIGTLVAGALIVVLIVTGGKRGTDSAQQKTGDHSRPMAKGTSPSGAGVRPPVDTDHDADTPRAVPPTVDVPKPPPPALPSGASLAGQWTREVDGLIEVWTIRSVADKWEIEGRLFDGVEEVGTFAGSDIKMSGRTLTFVQSFEKQPPQPRASGATVAVKLDGANLVFTWRHNGSSGSGVMIRVKR
ncbi:serine threonine protein partial : Serine/threonine protein kinase (Fragment) OS=Rhodopirellula maiorica SM1 GN=RMSM_03539 PE=4 SV=1: Pkinase [Gemmata massiliana]|uniref:Protein kinase domain-containing protein n=1 Tax=Gemmata massiliana TaxID=1210884 RepID=A0A6P2D0U4_9BACT